MISKRIISLLAAASLLMPSSAVYAENKITVPGRILYSQDFEGVVEQELTTKIGSNSAFSFEIYDDLGNKELKLNGIGGFGYNKFGPEYSDAIVKADVKQLGANGANGAYVGIGVRAARQSGGAYFSNMGTYFDAIKYNEETKLYDTTAELMRDRIGIVRTAGADYGKFISYDKVGEELGILKKQQIFTSSTAKAYERNFDGKYYRMQASLIGSSMTNAIKTSAGETLNLVSAEVEPVSTTGSGYTQLQAHSGVYLIDNIKIMSPVEISSFYATVNDETVSVGGSTNISLIGGDITIQPDVARYEYDDKALSIDFANGTIVPLKAGKHSVKVFLDDINGNGSLTSSFVITAVKADKKLEVVVDNPNPGYGESTAVTAYFGETDVTDEVVFDGDVEYSQHRLTPNGTGIFEISVSYEGQKVTVPIAVNDESKAITEQDTTPVFSEDFEGDKTKLNEKYSNGNASISVQEIANPNDNTKSNALYFDNIQASSSLFGPEDLKDYILEYDFWCKTPKGSSGSFVGATMRADERFGGYKAGYAPVMKYNEQTHKIDTTVTTNNNRQVTVAYGESNGIDKWYFGGFSGSSLQASQMQNYWFTQKSVISSGIISTELLRRDNNSFMAGYKYKLDSLEGASNSGATALSTSQNCVYFDNIRIYRLNKYNDIKIKCSGEEGSVSFETVGMDENGGEHSLTGTVTAAASGAVTLNGEGYTVGDGIGYVTVCYTDAYGVSKYKIIRTGNIATGGQEQEFAASGLKLCDENGTPLAALSSGKPVYAQVDLVRKSLGGNGAMLVIAIYDFDSEQMVVAEMVSAEAVQRVGESFRLYKKLVLPEDSSGSLYAKVMVMGTDLKPVTGYLEV